MKSTNLPVFIKYGLKSLYLLKKWIKEPYPKYIISIISEHVLNLKKKPMSVLFYKNNQNIYM